VAHDRSGTGRGWASDALSRRAAT